MNRILSWLFGSKSTDPLISVLRLVSALFAIAALAISTTAGTSFGRLIFTALLTLSLAIAVWGVGQLITAKSGALKFAGKVSALLVLLAMLFMLTSVVSYFTFGHPAALGRILGMEEQSSARRIFVYFASEAGAAGPFEVTLNPGQNVAEAFAKAQPEIDRVIKVSAAPSKYFDPATDKFIDPAKNELKDRSSVVATDISDAGKITALLEGLRKIERAAIRESIDSSDANSPSMELEGVGRHGLNFHPQFFPNETVDSQQQNPYLVVVSRRRFPVAGGSHMFTTFGPLAIDKIFFGAKAGSVKSLITLIEQWREKSAEFADLFSGPGEMRITELDMAQVSNLLGEYRRGLGGIDGKKFYLISNWDDTLQALRVAKLGVRTCKPTTLIVDFKFMPSRMRMRVMEDCSASLEFGERTADMAYHEIQNLPYYSGQGVLAASTLDTGTSETRFRYLFMGMKIASRYSRISIRCKEGSELRYGTYRIDPDDDLAFSSLLVTPTDFLSNSNNAGCQSPNAIDTLDTHLVGFKTIFKFEQKGKFDDKFYTSLKEN